MSEDKDKVLCFFEKDGKHTAYYYRCFENKVFPLKRVAVLKSKYEKLKRKYERYVFAACGEIGEKFIPKYELVKAIDKEKKRWREARAKQKKIGDIEYCSQGLLALALLEKRLGLKRALKRKERRVV